MRLIDADQFKNFSIQNHGNKNHAYISGMIEVLRAINNAPTIDAQPVVHAYFKDVKIRPEYPWYYTGYCSRCNKFQNTEVNYCCNCGAKIDGEDNDYEID